MEKRPKKPFSLAGSKEPVVRDKDNAAPRIKPPQLANTPHPRLAPAGMSGIRPSLNPGQPRPLPPPPAKAMQDHQGKAQRAFKPLVQGPQGKDKGHDR